MAKTIVILGTLDTKGEQLQLLKDKILARGHRAILMDMGMGSEPRVKPDITAREIAGLMGLFLGIQGIRDGLPKPGYGCRGTDDDCGSRPEMK